MSQSKKMTDSEQAGEVSRRRHRDRAAPSPAQLRHQEQQFKRENAEAFASMNAWVEEHGLPLEQYRQF